MAEVGASRAKRGGRSTMRRREVFGVRVLWVRCGRCVWRLARVHGMCQGDDGEDDTTLYTHKHKIIYKENCSLSNYL